MPIFDAEGIAVTYMEKVDPKDTHIPIEGLIVLVAKRLKHQKGGACPFHTNAWGSGCLHTDIKNIIEVAPPEMLKHKAKAQEYIRANWPDDKVVHILNMCGDGGTCDNMPNKK